LSYKDLKSYQNSVYIYDFTVEFAKLYVRHYSRTRDQMEQAARSCKQNIVEGTEASKTSKKTELKLIGVARASLQELLEDYSDYLRQNNLKVWLKDDQKAKAVRALVYRTDRTYGFYKSYIANPEDSANVMVCLINQTNYLLDQQIKVLEEKFLSGGGYTENLFKRRLEHKNKRSSN
jgi:restriction system protein